MSSVSDTDGALSVFDGGGELGERMRAFDWSRTALGPVALWPQSLKTCVRIVLTSRQPMFVWWGERLINIYNDAYKSIVGGKHPAALGQPASIVWREIWDEVKPRAERAMRGNEGTYDEALLLIMERHGYQEETYYTFSYSPVPNERGGTGGILCANTDDTQRIIGERRLGVLRELATRTADARRPEDACAQAAAALELGQRDLPFALIYLADPDGSTLSLAGATGITAGTLAAPIRIDATADAPWPIRDVLREHTHRVIEPLSKVFAELPAGIWGQAPSRAVVWPLTPSGQTGRAGVLIAALNPFRPFDDDFRSFVSLVAGQVSAGIANAQAYEEERRRAEALAEIDRTKTAFFSNVSHEFRTPLTLMLGPQEDALALPDGALSGESLKAVHRNTLRLLRLVNNLLEFSRIEAGRATAFYQPSDLSRLTVDLSSAFRSAIERGGLRFDVDCPPLSQPVHVDRALWETIVLNLISNAFKFTLKGTIRVALRERDGHAELRVIDTGVGIPARELPRMFERFHRVEATEARTHEGSGIGLALVKELVNLHGGQISVDSQEGKGTTFTVAIPFGTAHLTKSPASVARESLGERGAARAEPFVEEALRWIDGSTDKSSDPAGGKPDESPVAEARVLVADDNADMREYLARLLGEHWQVETATNGREALLAAERRRPDLILSDVMMPKLDGFGLLREIRRRPALAETPIVLLSARAGEESRVEGLEAGADDYLIKPFTAKELLARVRSHLESARLRRAAETERHRLRLLLGQLPAIVNFLRGPELVIEYAHPMTIQTLGGRDIVGKPLLEAIPEFREQEYPRLLRRVIETGERIEGRDKLVQIAGPDGSLRDTYWSYVYLPLHDAQGRLDGVMTFDLDVTESVLARMKIEEQAAALAAANDQAQVARATAETANRAKDEFLAMLGHELRNPLSPILTALQLMRMRTGEMREQAVIERQVAHLVRLVDDLLDISRITRGKIELRRQTIELAAVVTAGVEMARPLLEQRRQRLDIDVPPEGLLVDVDPDRLAQVVSNLLTNAAKYSDFESTVHVRAWRDGAKVQLAVRDEGVGLAPEMLDRVFEIFFQQPQSIDRSKGGLGLGLAIVRSLVTLHGGTITAKSDGLGRGSEFFMELPALPAVVEPPDLSVDRLMPRLSSTANGGDGSRVLIVDDNVDAADTLTELLQYLGYVVRATYDAESVLELASEFRPDVCILDIGLPVIDGYELARRLRKTPAGRSMRLIAVTGYGQDADRRQAREAGFDDHFVKPPNIDALARVLAGTQAKIAG